MAFRETIVVTCDNAECNAYIGDQNFRELHGESPAITRNDHRLHRTYRLFDNHSQALYEAKRLGWYVTGYECYCAACSK